MDLEQLQAFVRIVEAGSFSRAAEAIHLSQPAISRRIALLEQELGAPLFERLSSGIVLSAAGQALLPHARRVQAALGDGRAAVRDVVEGGHGQVTLALVGTLASTGLTARLRQFRTAQPQVQVRLRTARSDEVSALVASGSAQLGLRYFAPAAPQLEAIIIDYEAVVPVCAAHAAISGQASLHELAALPWVSFPSNVSGSPFAALLQRTLQISGLAGGEIITIDSLTAQKRLIEADFGLGLLPESSIQEELALGTLRMLPHPELHARAPIALLWRREGYLSRAAQTLIAALRTSPDAGSAPV